MKRLAGQVSVFLALAGILLLGLFGACLESSRVALMDYLVEQAAHSSIQSIFAAYQGEVKREYGLLLARGRRNGSLSWPQEALHYAEKYLDPGAGTLALAGDRILLEDINGSALDSLFITDAGGRVFADEVLGYMKTAGLSLLLQEFLERLGLYSQEEGLSFVTSLQEMLGDKEKSPDSLLLNYQNLREEVEALQEAAAAVGGGDDTKPGEPPANPAPETPPPGELKSDLLEQIKAIQENGLIAVITGSETLSRYSWEDPALPSLQPGALDSGASISLLEHFLLGEYLMGKMGNYTARKMGGGQYEAEYVISGKDNDKSAFETVVGWILLIRMGFNMAYLMTDAAKLAQAEAVAVAVMSVLALPQLIAVLKWLLVAAWALAESIVDMKVLLKGKKEPLIKSAGSWQLAALSLDLSAGEGSTGGLGYEDYLRILYYLGDPATQCYRMMDVIQRRTALSAPGFLMSDYMVYGEWSLTADIPYLYIQSPLLLLIREGGGSRRYVKRAAYAYGRR